MFLFLYGCDERFVFCHGSGLPPDCFIGEGAVFSLVYINIPGEKDENDAGNQNQYSAPFSPGEIKEFFKGVLHDDLFQKTQFIDKNQCNSCWGDVSQNEYQQLVDGYFQSSVVTDFFPYDFFVQMPSYENGNEETA